MLTLGPAHEPPIRYALLPVAVAAVRTLAELAKHFGLHTNQITDWKRLLVEHASGAFGGGQEQAEPVDLAPLHAKIGQQAAAESARSTPAEDHRQTRSHHCPVHPVVVETFDVVLNQIKHLAGFKPVG